MQRREFIAGLGGGFAMAGLAHAQQPERVRRIGWIGRTQFDEIAFREALHNLGWIEGRNLQIDARSGDAERIDDLATELDSRAPEVIMAGGGGALIRELERRTHEL